jgi:redox-sensitive bicupin YhaK (pirin superfamily)
MSEPIVVIPKEKDLGGFLVRRALPTIQKRFVGPFVFLDHMGPAPIDATHAMDVRPHPHIGLATVTYLFEGHGYHRDNLGSSQLISPGDLNWMTAGRGIAHSERSPKEDRQSGSRLHGVQIWIGLPVHEEDREPSFTHWPKEKLPSFETQGGLRGKVLLGEFLGKRSPVQIFSRTLYLDLHASEQAFETLNFPEQEVALLLIQGTLNVNGVEIAPGSLAVLTDTKDVKVRMGPGSRAMVVGGDPFPEPRHMWWNYVSSSKEKIRAAAEAWKAQSWPKVPGETDFIPLPDDPLPK